jgi:hypothetical protein
MAKLYVGSALCLDLINSFIFLELTNTARRIQPTEYSEYYRLQLYRCLRANHHLRVTASFLIVLKLGGGAQRGSGGGGGGGGVPTFP